MKFTVLALTLAAALAHPMPASSDDLFTDGTCEKATPAGRHLNELVEKNNTLTPELKTAATQMRDIYEECVTGYDRDARSSSGRGGEQFTNTNGAIVGRLYARLALARALQRVAQYDVYDKDVVAARNSYDEALQRLDELERIEPFANSHPGTPERSLVMKGQALRPAIVAAKTALTGSAAPSVVAPAPAPSPTVK